MFKSSHRRGHWNVFNKQFTDLVMNQILLSRGHHYVTVSSRMQFWDWPPPPIHSVGSGGRFCAYTRYPPYPARPIRHQAWLFSSCPLPLKTSCIRAELLPLPLCPSTSTLGGRSRACQTRDWWFGRPRLGGPQCQIGRKHLGKAHR